MTRPVALKSRDITMAKRVALRLWPVDTQPKARRTVKVARSFSTVRRQRGGVTCDLSRVTFLETHPGLRSLRWDLW